MAFKIRPTRYPGPEVARVVRRLLARAAATAAYEDLPAGTRIHKVRTACKRARAALRLARVGDDRILRRENRWLRDTARALGSRRDAEISLLGLDALLQRTKKQRERHALMAARTCLAQRSTGAAAADAGDRLLETTATRLREAEERLGDWRPQLGWATFGRNLARAYTAARSAGKTARRRTTTRSLHEWRKAAKTCAYQCRLLRAVATHRLKKFRRELEALAKTLGEVHDLAVLRTELNQLARGRRDLGSRELDAALGCIDARREALQRAAFAVARAAYRVKPSAIKADVAAGSSAARGAERK